MVTDRLAAIAHPHLHQRLDAIVDHRQHRLWLDLAGGRVFGQHQVTHLQAGDGHQPMRRLHPRGAGEAAAAQQFRSLIIGDLALVSYRSPRHHWLLQRSLGRELREVRRLDPSPTIGTTARALLARSTTARNLSTPLACAFVKVAMSSPATRL